MRIKQARTLAFASPSHYAWYPCPSTPANNPPCPPFLPVFLSFCPLAFLTPHVLLLDLLPLST